MLTLTYPKSAARKTGHYFAFFPTSNRKTLTSDAVYCILERLWLSLWWDFYFSICIISTSHL